ncbi:hypothetical protein GCM10009678_00930 [Actinomadura kijaniata]|uniref:G6PDH family F420-dependent oxidoreductase n=1 Tax=Actinomadura namibiensis TaxID=182080 RepID=A0A7W3LSD3_ACTNM|nr:G6PDH family F420-dependent oxidoreductase [Actinomadura namibiensis]
MLEEAVTVIRRLLTGELVTHRGTHYRVDTARLFTLPERPPPIPMSGLGAKAARLAGRIADGYICTAPDTALLEASQQGGGKGKPTQAGGKVCWAPDAARARDTVRRLWPNMFLPGEAAQLLPQPRHFAQLASLVADQMAEQDTACGPDPEAHVAALRPCLEAGFDEVYTNQIGPDQEGFFDFYAERVLPRLRGPHP